MTSSSASVFVRICCAFVLLASVAVADGPKDNVADKVRPIPPLGMELSQQQRTELLTRCKEVRASWHEMLAGAEGAKSKNKWQRLKDEARIAGLKSFAPEVLVFPRAVEMAVEFQQFYKPGEIDNAKKLLDQAEARIEVARQTARWADVVGLGAGDEQQLIVGGYQSKIDGSYQPYSVVIPAGLAKGDSRPRRLDLWFHGRGETLSEVNFLNNQQNNPGQYTPADTFVLHPYGRYSNAFKFAGEVDVLEVLDYIKTRLPVDPDKVAVRGFSMGGAGCWQMAVHYADHFFAANPGAGFSETPEFLSFFQGEDAAGTAPEYQKTLWQLYDCPPWAANLNQCPTVAYSGEVDRQKQAADVMEVALESVGIDMTHIIGPDTAHKIHAESKREVESRMASIAGAADRGVPEQIHLRTMTLRYNRMHWVSAEGLQQHWKVASVDAEVGDHEIEIQTDNVTALKLQFAAGEFPGQTNGPVHVLIDGDEIVGPNVKSDRSFEMSLANTGDGWQAGQAKGVGKRPGLQGPIDDAFMDSFLFVLPSRRSDDPVVQAWVEAESQHAMTHWRKHFRGDVRSVKDTDLTAEEMAACNIVLFGDAKSNSVIQRLLPKLPIEWSKETIAVGAASVPAKSHVPILICPNPEQPTRYVVINSGFTFREYDYLNNARQTPKLPDWALVDVSDGANFQDPGKVKHAGFYDERWKP